MRHSRKAAPAKSDIDEGGEGVLDPVQSRRKNATRKGSGVNEGTRSRTASNPTSDDPRETAIAPRSGAAPMSPA